MCGNSTVWAVWQSLLNVWKFDIPNLTLRKNSAISTSSDKFSKTLQKLSNKIDPCACNQQEVVAVITGNHIIITSNISLSYWYFQATKKNAKIDYTENPNSREMCTCQLAKLENQQKPAVWHARFQAAGYLNANFPNFQNKVQKIKNQLLLFIFIKKLIKIYNY